MENRIQSTFTQAEIEKFGKSTQEIDQESLDLFLKKRTRIERDPDLEVKIPFKKPGSFDLNT